MLRDDEVARLLASEGVAALVHGLEYVAVADAGLHHGDVVLRHRDAEAEVAHDGRDERALREQAATGHREREDGHDLVAVDDGARVVDREAAVGVAVVRDADGGAVREDRLGQQVEVRGPDPVVDVHAVGVVADDGDAGARVREDLGADPGGGAVRAVEDHVDPVEPVLQRAEQVQDVAVLGVREAADAADVGSRGEQDGLAQLRLDAVLELVGELPSACGEELDPVVGSGVVRRGDHHAEVGVEVRDEVGRGRRRDDPGVEHVDAGAREAGSHGRRDELAGHPGIPGDDRDGSSPGIPGVLAEHVRGGLGQAQGEVGGDGLAVGESADAVRAEEPGLECRSTRAP